MAAITTPPSQIGAGPRFGPSSLAFIDQNLSLANGMTAGYGVNDGHVTNPPPQAFQYGYWPLQPLRVGFMRNTISLSGAAGAPNNPSGQYTLYFMYNPNQITIQWQTNPGAAAPTFLYGDTSAGSDAYQTAFTNAGGTAFPSVVPALAGAQTVGWSLYFDRTYDMMYGNSPGANPQDDRGVLKDVAALYNLMGTFISQAATPVSAPVEVVFGQNADGQLFGFTGYLSQMTITYGIFRHDMIPSQCEVDLTLMATYVQNAVNSNSQPIPTSTPPTAVPVPLTVRGTPNVYGNGGNPPSGPQGPPVSTTNQTPIK